VLDRWALARVEQATEEARQAMEAYEVSAALRALQECVTDMSQWYVRRSRDRFKGEVTSDTAAAARTLFEVLDTMARALAPFVPFMAEHVWRELHGADTGDSVHLAAWPMPATANAGPALELEAMAAVRALVSRALETRQSAKLPVRQVLQSLTIGRAAAFRTLFGADVDTYSTIIADEVNVLEVRWTDEQGDGEVPLLLDTALTPDLLRRGLARETMRTANDLRKAAGLTIHHAVELFWESASPEAEAMWAEHGGDIAKRVRATVVHRGTMEQATHVSEPMGGEAQMRLGIRVVA
jgi:isoleucyl-tRNA synthetase